MSNSSVASVEDASVSACFTADGAISALAALYGLCLLVLPIQHYKRPFVLLGLYFFVDYSWCHIGITYLNDNTHDYPWWMTVFVPIALSVVTVTLTAFLAEFSLMAVTFFLSVMLAALLAPLTAVLIGIAAAFMLCCGLMLCRHTGALKGLSACWENLVVGISATVPLVVACYSLYWYTNNQDPSELVRCNGHTNNYLLCDFRCASITSTQSVTWMMDWTIAVLVVVFVRTVAVLLFGYRDYSTLRESCCGGGNNKEKGRTTRGNRCCCCCCACCYKEYHLFQDKEDGSYEADPLTIAEPIDRSGAQVERKRPSTTELTANPADTATQDSAKFKQKRIARQIGGKSPSRDAVRTVTIHYRPEDAV